jgi:hypothetical protein
MPNVQPASAATPVALKLSSPLWHAA